MRRIVLVVVAALATVGLTFSPAIAKPPPHPGTCSDSKGLTTCVVTTTSTQTYLLNSWDSSGTFLGKDSNPFVTDWCNGYITGQGGPPRTYTAGYAIDPDSGLNGTPEQGAVTLSKTTTTTTTTTYRGTKTVSQSTTTKTTYNFTRVTGPNTAIYCEEAPA